MNALKHMEAVFVIALSVAGIGSYLVSTAQVANAAPVQTAQTVQKMAVVTVVGRRMTAAEKAQSLREEAAANATLTALR
jgi:hypothetical protein